MADDGDDFCDGPALAFAREDGTDGAALPVVVALHARGGDAAQAVAAARRRFGPRADVLAPQAARPCNPFQSNLREAAGYAGFSWYLGDDPARPEAASFGDALAQLDAFVRALSRPFVLTGDGQGAALACALALYAPEGLVGVHACGSSIPSIDGWEPPAATLAGIAFLLSGIDTAGLARAQEMLEARRAIVTDSPASAASWLDAIAAGAKDSNRA